MLRVIGGRFRGRVLRAPRGLSTRPTAARVRKALFDVLGDLSGARVLDLFAGSGALGIEALSRGAVSVTFVESSRPALDALRANLASLDTAADETRVLPLAVARAGAALAAQGPFDLVLCDPPWPAVERASREVEPALAHCLSPSAGVVFGHRAGEEPLLPDSLELSLTERRAWGDSAMSFFRRQLPPQ